MAQQKPKLPIDDLTSLVDEIDKLFDNITEYWSCILFREGMRQPLVDAWSEVKPKLNTIRDALDSPDAQVAKKLADAGLTGQQLDLKLKGLSEAWARFQRRGSVRLLRKVLDWINILLGSLASILPGGEGVKELKEAIEKLIGEDG